MQSIFHAGFLFFHFGFCGRTDIDHGNAANEFGETFLEFFAIVIGCGFFDLLTNDVHAGLQGFFLASAVDDGCVFFINHDSLGMTQRIQTDGVEFDAQFFGNHFAAGKDTNVFQHGFATITKTGGLHGANLQGAA
ncbi:MAG: DNA polymerase II large subunit [uncultured bacterium]|nr:MAG: DNA polymerase II large subunit [uncultured bacterium]